MSPRSKDKRLRRRTLGLRLRLKLRLRLGLSLIEVLLASSLSLLLLGVAFLLFRQVAGAVHMASARSSLQQETVVIFAEMERVCRNTNFVDIHSDGGSNVSFQPVATTVYTGSTAYVPEVRLYSASSSSRTLVVKRFDPSSALIGSQIKSTQACGITPVILANMVADNSVSSRVLSRSLLDFQFQTQGNGCSNVTLELQSDSHWGATGGIRCRLQRLFFSPVP